MSAPPDPDPLFVEADETCPECEALPAFAGWLPALVVVGIALVVALKLAGWL